jgi:hypothetical protein
MKPTINHTAFGSIIINDTVFDHDVIIRLDGKVKKRKKKLSKAVHGTSHILSLEEARYVYEEGTDVIIIGGGQYSCLKLSDKATRFFQEKNCQVHLQDTPEAIKIWNNTKEKEIIGLFHVTC